MIVFPSLHRHVNVTWNTCMFLCLLYFISCTCSGSDVAFSKSATFGNRGPCSYWRRPMDELPSNAWNRQLPLLSKSYGGWCCLSTGTNIRSPHRVLPHLPRSKCDPQDAFYDPHASTDAQVHTFMCYKLWLWDFKVSFEEGTFPTPQNCDVLKLNSLLIGCNIIMWYTSIIFLQVRSIDTTLDNALWGEALLL